MAYLGSCHCGIVQFQVDYEPSELTTCDCSLCRKKNAVMFAAPAERLTVTAGEGTLREYRWNTRVARHFFCGTCGIYVFHRKRSAPELCGVNVFCLEGFDPAGYPVRRAEGSGMSVTPGAAARFPGPTES